MVKSKFKRKGKFKSIICAILVVASVIGVFAGVTALFKRDTKTISSTNFALGSIDSSGAFVDSKNSIYTKDMFECKGLVIEPSFELNTTYSIFFYNYDGLFLECEENMSGKFVSAVPELAKYARVVVNSTDGEDIPWYKVSSVARDLKITVSRNQDFSLTNWFELDEEHEGKQVTYNPDAGTNGTNLFVQYVSYMSDGTSNEDKAPIKPVNVSNWKSVALVYEKGYYSSSELVYFFAKPMVDGSGNRIVSTSGEEQWQIIPVDTRNIRFNDNMTQIVIDVPEGATHFFANTFIEEEYHYSLYQYR